MQAVPSTGVIGCIGKCMSGLTVEELDQITDNISKTLSHPKGRQILAKYLEQNNLKSALDCLDLYNDCLDFLAKVQLQLKECYVESLTVDITTIMEKVDSVNGVEQLDIVLLRQFDEALTNGTREALLAVIEETKNRVQDYLKDLFRQSVTDVQLDSIDILPETLKRHIQRTWHQKYDTLLSQNERLRKEIIILKCTLKEKQKEIQSK